MLKTDGTSELHCIHVTYKFLPTDKHVLYMLRVSLRLSDVRLSVLNIC